MIPIQLTIEGLYSYQGRQTIDFSHLTEAGLFGIFGTVGSGKSSILEAISYVLYGETERLNNQDKRTYNMMNLKSNKSYIEFDFINFENRVFRATREFKRNSKNFSDIRTATVQFYEKIEGAFKPIEITKAEEIIGLSYANFKRTIIIPQGQFKEFLELGAADRTTMMKEIFGLHQYDLHQKATKLLSQNKDSLNLLEGELKGFEAVSQEEISQQKELVSAEDLKLQDALKIFNEIKEQFEKLTHLKQEFELLQKHKENCITLDQESKEIDALEILTEKFDQVSRVFSPLMNEKKKVEKEIQDQMQLQEIQVNKFQSTEVLFNSIKKQIEEITPQFEALEKSKIQENDLALIIQLIDLSEEIKTLKERSEKGKSKVEEVKVSKKQLEEKIKEFEKQLQELKSQKLDTTLLTSVDKWFSDYHYITKSYQDKLEAVKLLEKEILGLKNELTTYSVTEEDYLKIFSDKEADIENQKKNLADKKTQLEVQQKLAAFANALHDGENCPLCGSLEHPHIVNFDDVSLEITALEEQLSTLKKAESKVQKDKSEVEKIINKQNIYSENLKKENAALADILAKIELHKKAFSWKEFSMDNEEDFEAKKQQSIAIETQISVIEEQLSATQKSEKDEALNLEKFQKALEEFKQKEIEKNAQAKTLESQIKILIKEDWISKTPSDVKTEYQNLVDQNLSVEKKYKELNLQEKEVAPQLAEQKSNVEHTEKRILEYAKEISEFDEKIQQSLVTEKMENLDEVLNILAQNIDIPANRSKIQQFRIDYQTLKNSIQQLEEKLKGLTFDEEKFRELEENFNKSNEEQKQIHDGIVKLKAEIERLEKEFTKKEDLLKQLDQLKKRAEDLTILNNLFKASGFVEYVSSIYLRQLCEHANVRFHKMTKNQLSLQLSDDYKFEIIDYLNEGKIRSVKTLSGGQAFQVSLSLALALAESVQSNTKAEKNFFFIDEGFGTQDIESVNIVFETLTNLQKENRIVGIISHVEELKERMPISLNIRKDEDKGSLIEVV